MSAPPASHHTTRPLDVTAAAIMVVLCLSWGFNQVATKLAIHDIPPLTQAAIRSVVGAIMIALYCKARGLPLFERDGSLWTGIVLGVFFGGEFILIYQGLVYTTATRAVLEAVAWQVAEVAGAMAADAGQPLTTLKADGGMTANTLLMQFQADVLDVPVVRPRVAEKTCLGAAYAAGLAVGFWPDLETLRRQWARDAEWTPAMATAVRERELKNWKKAVQRTLDWVD